MGDLSIINHSDLFNLTQRGESGFVRFSATLAAFIKTGLDAPEALVGTLKGDAKAVIAASERKFERVYFYPFQNHATMEPMNTTVLWTSERCEA